MIILLETWQTKNDCTIRFGDFKIVDAIRVVTHEKSKRCSGGQLILYKLKRVALNLLVNDCDHFVTTEITNPESRTDSLTIISCYILPKETTFVCKTCSGDYYEQFEGLYRNTGIEICLLQEI